MTQTSQSFNDTEELTKEDIYERNKCFERNRFLKKITRLEVITELKREFVRYGCKIKLSVQDDGRTLKVFVGDRK